MATKIGKKNAIRHGTVDVAIVYSQNLAGVKTRFLAKDFYKNAKKSIPTIVHV